MQPRTESAVKPKKADNKIARPFDRHQETSEPKGA